MRNLRFLRMAVPLVMLSSCAYNIEAHKVDTNGEPAILVEKSDMNINLSVGQTVNHAALNLGAICSAHTYNVNIGNDLEYYFSLLDVSGALNDADGADASVSIDSASSNIRCIMAGFSSGLCSGTVSLNGHVETKNLGKKKFSIEKKSQEKTVACEGAVNSLVNASKDVTQELLNMVKNP